MNKLQEWREEAEGTRERLGLPDRYPQVIDQKRILYLIDYIEKLEKLVYEQHTILDRCAYARLGDGKTRINSPSAAEALKALSLPRPTLGCE